MGGMGNIRETVSIKQFEVLQVLGKALQQEELELEQLQKNLVQARQLVDGVLETDGAGVQDTLRDTAPANDNIITITAESVEEQIRRRAAQIFVERGGGEGRDIEYWLAAEAEILGRSSSDLENSAAEPAVNTETNVERIRSRAEEICVARGGEPGHDVEDWLQAEAEILAESRAIAETDRDTAVCLDLEDLIRQRAVELFLEHGGEPGRDVEHWLQAETEVRAAHGIAVPAGQA